MRLRLTIQRNGLPDANILWSVPVTANPQTYTIARLLEDVNLIVPLEAEHWGLEHYVVELAGFECLHFSPVAQTLKEDDHVSIRPLVRAEVRSRTLTGRSQISNGGQHLIDGVPFGRPLLREPRRPAVRIPPQKRPRLEEADARSAEVPGYPLDSPSVDELYSVMAVTGDTTPLSIPGSASGRSAKAIQFKQPEAELLGDGDDDDEDDDDDDDEDFEPSEGNDDNLDGGDFGSSGASDSTDSDSDDSSSDSDSDSDSGESSGPEIMSSKGAPQNMKPATVQKSPVHVPPGAGKKTTQSRNARRTMANRLRLLKASGELHKDATLKDLTKYEEQKRHGYVEEEPQSGRAFGQHTGKRKRIEDEEPTNDSAEELARRKQQLMARFAEDTASETTRADQPVQTVTIENKSTPQTAASKDKDMQEPSLEPQERVSSEKEATSELKATRRLRPDTSAIGRILARQARSTARKPAKAKEPTPEPEGASDPDFWKTRINLSAFECWNEEFELSAPPFPFKQHWDPAGKLMREQANKKKQKRAKKAAPVEEVVEEEEEEERIFLNYDDGPDTEMDAAIDEQVQQDIVVAAQSDLPGLPEDVDSLPQLQPSDIKVGAIIVCKFFEINPKTVTPEYSGFKTARVEKEGDSGYGAGTIRLRFAERDVPKRQEKYDRKGKRVYDAADAFFVDGGDEGLWDGMFNELLEPKLLQAG